MPGAAINEDGCRKVLDTAIAAITLESLPKKQSVVALRSAASAVCTALEIHQPEAQRYLQKLVEDLYPRIHAALSAGSLEGIFLTCQ